MDLELDCASVALQDLRGDGGIELRRHGPAQDIFAGIRPVSDMVLPGVQTGAVEDEAASLRDPPGGVHVLFVDEDVYIGERAKRRILVRRQGKGDALEDKAPDLRGGERLKQTRGGVEHRRIPRSIRAMNAPEARGRIGRQAIRVRLEVERRLLRHTMPYALPHELGPVYVRSIEQPFGLHRAGVRERNAMAHQVFVRQQVGL